MRLDHDLPSWLRRPLSRLAGQLMRMQHNLERMDKLMSDLQELVYPSDEPASAEPLLK
jgi:hypothetical protein